MSSFGGEAKPSVPYRRFAACKRSPLSAKLPVIAHPQFPLPLLEVCRVVVDVGAPGGESGNFQSRVSAISLQAAVLSGVSAAGPYQKKKKKKNVTQIYL
jgi:hypothetical protein